MRQAVKTYQIHVPTEQSISPGTFEAWLARVAKVCGGFTVQAAHGGYVMDSGELVHEPVQIVTASAFTYSRAVELRGLFEGLIIELLTDGRQEAVLVDLGEGPSLYTQQDVNPKGEQDDR